MSNWHEYFNQKMKEHSTDRQLSRSEHRNTWFQILVLCSAILGFSAAFIGGERAVAQNTVLIISWTFLTPCIAWGIVLLLKDSKDYLRQSSKSFFYTQDIVRIETENLAKEEHDNQFMALSVLHTPEDFWSEKAKEIFKKHKNKLDSWRFLKNPERFYFGNKSWYIKMYNRVFSEPIFLTLFFIGLALMVISVIIPRI